MYSAQNGHLEVSRELLQWGAKLGLRNNKGATALMYSVQNGHLEICCLLSKL